jgi:hypothetical protein
MTDPKACNNDLCTPDTAACHIPYDSICLAQWMKQYDEERQKKKTPGFGLIQMKSKLCKGSLEAAPAVSVLGRSIWPGTYKRQISLSY